MRTHASTFLSVAAAAAAVAAVEYSLSLSSMLPVTAAACRGRLVNLCAKRVCKCIARVSHLILYRTQKQFHSSCCRVRCRKWKMLRFRFFFHSLNCFTFRWNSESFFFSFYFLSSSVPLCTSLTLSLSPFIFSSFQLYLYLFVQKSSLNFTSCALDYLLAILCRSDDLSEYVFTLFLSVYSFRINAIACQSQLLLIPKMEWKIHTHKSHVARHTRVSKKKEWRKKKPKTAQQSAPDRGIGLTDTLDFAEHGRSIKPHTTAHSHIASLIETIRANEMRWKTRIGFNLHELRVASIKV